jgi:hypothetical protein
MQQRRFRYGLHCRPRRSLNLHRRHLDESQRAIVAAKIAKLPKGANQHTAPANLPTQSRAAELLNVSERSVRAARSVIDHGAPELVHAVEQGRVSVSAAEAAARQKVGTLAPIGAKGKASERAAEMFRGSRAAAIISRSSWGNWRGNTAGHPEEWCAKTGTESTVRFRP